MISLWFEKRKTSRLILGRPMKLLATSYCLTITYNRAGFSIDHWEIRCKKFMYFAHRGCGTHTHLVCLRHWYGVCYLVADVIQNVQPILGARQPWCSGIRRRILRSSTLRVLHLLSTRPWMRSPVHPATELTMGHGSNGSTYPDGSHGSQNTTNCQLCPTIRHHRVYMFKCH